MKGYTFHCPNCDSRVIARNAFEKWQCFKCRKVFFRPKILKKEFKNISLFGDSDESN